jgi:uncharacterized repeat protein (TIGR01451 family)
MKLALSSIFAASLSLFVLATPALAAQTPNCEQIYGGGITCEQNDPITINKQIQNPENQEYVDSLPPEAAAFKPGQTIRFKLTVSNVGNNAVSNIAVRDIFPVYLEYAKGSGTYDAKTRTFSFTIDSLEKQSNKVYFVEAKVAAADKLPNSPQISCVINQARVEANRKVSQDNVKACVSRTDATAQAQNKPTTSKGGLPIYPPTQSKSTPETGPEALALIGLAPLGALGFYLRKKA